MRMHNGFVVACGFVSSIENEEKRREEKNKSKQNEKRSKGKTK